MCRYSTNHLSNIRNQLLLTYNTTLLILYSLSCVLRHDRKFLLSQRDIIYSIAKLIDEIKFKLNSARSWMNILLRLMLITLDYKLCDSEILMILTIDYLTQIIFEFCWYDLKIHVVNLK